MISSSRGSESDLREEHGVLEARPGELAREQLLLGDAERALEVACLLESAAGLSLHEPHALARALDLGLPRDGFCDTAGHGVVRHERLGEALAHRGDSRGSVRGGGGREDLDEVDGNADGSGLVDGGEWEGAARHGPRRRDQRLR
jgi:hypothetical protein